MAKTFTIHLPPGGAPRTVAGADTLVFVKDGFVWLAFLFPILWMLFHLMGWPILGYLALVLVAEIILIMLDASDVAMITAALLLQVVFGFEANAVRRWSLKRKGWQLIGVVNGRDLSEAEEKAFDWWLSGTLRGAAPVEIAMERAAEPHDEPEVIGLFPSPEAKT